MYVYLYVLWGILYVLKKFRIFDEKTYQLKKWNFILKEKHLDEVLEDFSKKYHNNIYEWFLIRSHRKAILHDNSTPQFILEKVFQKHMKYMQGVPLVLEENQLSYQDYDARYEACITTIVTTTYQKSMKKYNSIQYVVGNHLCETKQQFRKYSLRKFLKDSLFLALYAIVLVTMTFCFATTHVRWDIVEGLFTDAVLFFLNYIPILYLLIALYCCRSSLVFSTLTGGFLVFTMSTINYFKFLYRDEPFVISDIMLISEAKDMAGKYDTSFDYKQWLAVFVIIFLAILIRRFTRKQYIKKSVRYITLTITSACFFFACATIYQDNKIHDSHGNLSLINRWSNPQNYQLRGFMYPFIHSWSYSVERKPEAYDPQKAQETLQQYPYENMPEHKKVNMIGIMLESYNDFSRYPGFVFETDPYQNFHEIQKESIHGYFIANIFGGGTVHSERSWLNGFNNHPKYLKNTNSFVRYFNEQGYYTEAMHPCYGFFYNRRNINPYLGFQNFYYVENYFKEIIGDHMLFNELIKGYEENKTRNQPYMNFTLTYQNHGPYEPTPIKTTYVKKNDQIEDEIYHIVNKYFAGIADTDQAMKTLFDYFRSESEPVIIYMYGDHNPVLGDGNKGFFQNGMTLDLGTVEGFKEYYEIPYIIWANPAAKEQLQLPFDEEGEQFSGLYFLPYLFEYMGLKGNPYMQYLQEMRHVMPVINEYFYLVEGNWTKTLSPLQEKILNDFRNVEYYYSHNLQEYNVGE